MGIGERRGGLGPPPVIRPAVAPRTAPWPAPPACAVERPRHPRMSAPKPHANVPLVGASAGHPQGAAGAHNWGRRHRFCLGFLCLVTLPSECGPLFLLSLKRTASGVLLLRGSLQGQKLVILKKVTDCHPGYCLILPINNLPFDQLHYYAGS